MKAAPPACVAGGEDGMSLIELKNVDCRIGMSHSSPGSVDLVFADPPFNIGVKYDACKDRMFPLQYLAWSRTWMMNVWDVLKETGTFWLAIGDDYVSELDHIARVLGFVRRNWVIWHYTFGVHCVTKFNRSHTHLLYYVKNKKRFTWNRLLVPSDRQTKYGDKRAAQQGKTPDDVWQFSRVCGTFKERNRIGCPCQMPEAILARIIRACSNEGDLVLDPFAGSGTTLAVAKKLNRRFVGFEVSAKYCVQIQKRLDVIQIGDPIASE